MVLPALLIVLSPTAIAARLRAMESYARDVCGGGGTKGRGSSRNWTGQWVPLVSCALALVSGCTTAVDQSALHPAGPAAAEIAWLWWFMLGTFSAVFLLVLVLLFVAISRGPERAANIVAEASDSSAPEGASTGFIVAGGIVLPVAVLLPLFVLSLRTSASLRQPDEKKSLTVRVVGHMWWWEVRYPEHDIVTANEIHIPVGEPVRLELASADVIHTFWVPRLNGKRDMIPGMETAFWIRADEAGIYRGQCSEYCGTQHANMSYRVIALERTEFDAWLAERRRPRGELQNAAERRGYEVFMTAGCPQCHAVRSTAAKGNAGPDLTHLGSRRMIGGEMRVNHRAELAGWIADAQAIKPGIKMPRTYLAADDLMALVTYLESLK
jgi:cytochrome c oxidase subunit 2